MMEPKAKPKFGWDQGEAASNLHFNFLENESLNIAGILVAHALGAVLDMRCCL